MENPIVTRQGALDMQVCVPKHWNDHRAKRFADVENPCGTTNGWFMRKDGNVALEGAPERRPCAKRKDFVHIMFDA